MTVVHVFFLLVNLSQAPPPVPQMQVRGLTGPQAGKMFDISAADKGPPAMLVVVTNVSRHTRLFVGLLDAFARKLGKANLQAHIIFPEEKDIQPEDYVKMAQGGGPRKYPKIESPLWLGPDRQKMAALLQVNDKVQLVILLAKGGKVMGRYVLQDEPRDADFTLVVLAMANLAGKEPPKLTVQKDKENVVAGQLEGTWQKHADLTKRLVGFARQGQISFKSDPAILDKLPFKYHIFLDDKTIFMAGMMRLDNTDYPFVLLSHHGNPHLVYFRANQSGPLGDAESFNLFIAKGRDKENDLLFIGGDFNNQPFSAFERVKP